MREHWVFRYLGRPYKEGAYDCLNLVIDILKEVYGKKTPLYSNHGDTTLESQKLLTFGLENHSEELKHPIDGAMACLSYGGRTRHLGIYYVYRGSGNIIHVGSKTGGTVTCKVNRLHTQGLKVINYVNFKSII